MSSRVLADSDLAHDDDKLSKRPRHQNLIDVVTAAAQEGGDGRVTIGEVREGRVGGHTETFLSAAPPSTGFQECVSDLDRPPAGAAAAVRNTAHRSAAGRCLLDMP